MKEGKTTEKELSKCLIEFKLMVRKILTRLERRVDELRKN